MSSTDVTVDLGSSRPRGAPATSDLVLGETIPGTPYVALKRLGRGGMGDVYEVAQGGSGGPRYALKLLHAALCSRDDLTLRFQQEAMVTAGVDHPNVIRVFGLGETADGRPYLVMELLRGRDLRAEIVHVGPLPVARALDLAAQVLDGLAAAHAAGVVHRDVKLENLFLCEDGTLKVLDFGVAKNLHEDASLTLPGAVVGTLRSMAPEQFAQAAVDARADVYAAGLALYELITGRGPFDELRGLPLALQFAHCELTPPSPSSVARRTFAAGVDDAILRSLAKSPADRFQSAGEMASVLRRLGARARPWGRPARRLVRAWIPAALAAIFALGVAVGRAGAEPLPPAAQARIR